MQAKQLAEQRGVIGYVRVSTQEQERNGVSLDSQREAITDEVEKRGWKLIEISEDRGKSAKTLKRAGLQDALGKLKRGEAGVLIVSKLDRLSRSVLDFSGLMQRAQKEGWAIVALDLGVDTTSPSGEMMANVLITFAQFERKLIGQRTKDALAVKKSQGVRLGRPRHLPKRVGNRIRREREKGATLAGIAEGLNRDKIDRAQGGARWYPSTVQAILRQE